MWRCIVDISVIIAKTALVCLPLMLLAGTVGPATLLIVLLLLSLRW